MSIKNQIYEKKSISNYDENNLLIEKNSTTYSSEEITPGSLKEFFTRVVIQKPTDLQIYWNNDQYEIKWRKDMEEIEETDAEINISHIPLKEMVANPKVSIRFLNSSSHMDVKAFIFERIKNRFTEEENRCFLFGNGEKEIHGILHNMYFDTIKKVSLEKSKNIIMALLEMEHKLPNVYKNDASWIMSRSFLLDLESYAYSKENNFNLLKDGLNYTLFGRKIFIFDDNSYNKDKNYASCILIHKGAYVVMETNITMMENPYFSPPDVQLVYRKYVGGGVVVKEAIVFLTK
ncbi:hypothetical protein AB836_00350 [Rickettsiales bacterium (ex Bugula neritina AB1)]|nr:hypothetical protein AB836_00350 [Rickettsiales bacterium (ex Bugula neritina AB1)]